MSDMKQQIRLVVLVLAWLLPSGSAAALEYTYLDGPEDLTWFVAFSRRRS